MRVAVVGANGQLGADVVYVAAEVGHEPVAITHAEADIREAAAVRRVLAAAKADVIVNTAAMNHVERCELEPELAMAVNADGVRNLAQAAAGLRVPLVHVSTDYVFDGEKHDPYVEDDPTGPLNAYGASKLAGERYVREAHERHFIVRTSALYGVNPCRSKPQDNFVRAMLRLGREQGQVTVVRDESVTPTHTRDLAQQLLRLCETELYGTYHATAQGSCSWYDFAQTIFELAGLEVSVEPALGAQRNGGVRRPRNSELDNAALRRIGLDLMPHWRDSLAAYLAMIGPGATGGSSPAFHASI